MSCSYLLILWTGHFILVAWFLKCSILCGSLPQHQHCPPHINFLILELCAPLSKTHHQRFYLRRTHRYINIHLSIFSDPFWHFLIFYLSVRANNAICELISSRESNVIQMFLLLSTDNHTHSAEKHTERGRGVCFDRFTCSCQNGTAGKKKKSIKQVLFFKQNPVLRMRQQSRQRERETEAEINLFYILKHMIYHLRHTV